MDKQEERNFHTFSSSEEVIREKNYQDIVSFWKITEKNDVESAYHKSCDSLSSVDLVMEDSIESSSSISASISSDFMEDASSSSSSTSSSSNGPLYQLSDLMDQLPIKRGLSKYYQGKSQTFASLTNVENLEDLAKRENPYRKRMKLCKSFCGGFDAHKLTSPKSTISKKSSYKSSYSSSVLRRKCSNNFMSTCRISPIPVHQDF